MDVSEARVKAVSHLSPREQAEHFRLTPSQYLLKICSFPNVDELKLSLLSPRLVNVFGMSSTESEQAHMFGIHPVKYKEWLRAQPWYYGLDTILVWRRRLIYPQVALISSDVDLGLYDRIFIHVTGEMLQPLMHLDWNERARALGINSEHIFQFQEHLCSQRWYLWLSEPLDKPICKRKPYTRSERGFDWITEDVLRPIIHLNWKEMTKALGFEETKLSGLYKYCLRQPWYAALKAASTTNQGSIRIQPGVTAAEVGTSNLPAPAPGVDPFDDFDVGMFEPVAKKARLEDSALPGKDEGGLETTQESSGGHGDGFDWDGYAGGQEFDFNGIGNEPAYDQRVDPSGLGDGAA